MTVRFKKPTVSLEANPSLELDSVIKLIQKKHKVYFGKPASELQILQAEKSLKLDFPEPYRTFLSKYGSMSFAGTEIMGLTGSNQSDVVKNTLDQRKNIRSFPYDVFVVEDLGIDALLAVMTPDGKVGLLKAGVAQIKTEQVTFLEYLSKVGLDSE